MNTLVKALLLLALLYVASGCAGEETLDWPAYPAVFKFTGLVSTPSQFYLYNDTNFELRSPSQFQLDWSEILIEEHSAPYFIAEYSSATYVFLSESTVRILLQTEGGQFAYPDFAYSRNGNQIVIHSASILNEDIYLETTPEFLTMQYCILAYGKFQISSVTNEAGYFPFYYTQCSFGSTAKSLARIESEITLGTGDSLIVNLSPAVYIRVQ